MHSSPSHLSESLRNSLIEQWPEGGAWSQTHMQVLKAKGLAHDHVRLCGKGYLARIPKQSQMRLNVADNLAYQQACFERASPAGHAPQCVRTLAPCSSLPRGALIVQEIVGRSALLPHDLPLMAQSMAAMHSVGVPSSGQHAPLIHAADPLQALWDEVQSQAHFLATAHLEATVLSQIHSELAQFEAICQDRRRPQRRLIAFDGHPGNFVIASLADGGEKAYLVDLEKCRYSYPGLDLAHATLYTSTTWDIDTYTVLCPQEVMATYQAWSQHVDTALAHDALPWHLPLRRAMWLWSVTWCAKWRVASRAAAALSQDGEDWSDENLDPTLAKHVRERVDHYLSADGVGIVMAEFAQLSELMALEPSAA